MIANRLNQYERILADGARLAGLETVFNSNNFLPLCFLTDDVGEREKAAKIAMRGAAPISKVNHKTWLHEQEKSIIKLLGVNKLVIR